MLSQDIPVSGNFLIADFAVEGSVSQSTTRTGLGLWWPCQPPGPKTLEKASQKFQTSWTVRQ